MLIIHLLVVNNQRLVHCSCQSGCCCSISSRWNTNHIILYSKNHPTNSTLKPHSFPNVPQKRILTNMRSHAPWYFNSCRGNVFYSKRIRIPVYKVAMIPMYTWLFLQTNDSSSCHRLQWHQLKTTTVPKKDTHAKGYLSVSSAFGDHYTDNLYRWKRDFQIIDWIPGTNRIQINNKSYDITNDTYAAPP